jgi:hypothetical protein
MIVLKEINSDEISQLDKLTEVLRSKRSESVAEAKKCDKGKGSAKNKAGKSMEKGPSPEKGDMTEAGDA